MGIKDIEKQEELVRKMVSDLKKELLGSLSDVKIKGVNPIGSTGNMAVVSLSALRNGIWSPSRYLVTVQVKAIADAVAGAETLKELKKKLQSFIDTRRVVVKGETILLDDEIVKRVEKILTT